MSSRQLLETHNYSSHEEDILVIINILCSSFSFIGALFIMLNYLMFTEFKQNFAFKLIFCVAIGDLVSSISNFFGNPQHNWGLCVIQGILSEAGALTSICWVTAISVSIWLIISAKSPPTIEDTSAWLKRMHIAIWSYIFICSLLPLATNSYGAAGGWCWIKGGKGADNAWRFVLFYIPLWICVAFITFVYCKVWNKLSATAQQSKQSQAFLENEEEESVSEIDSQSSNMSKSKKDSSSKSSTLQRMKYYPMILMICYTPATVRRLSELFTSDQVISPFWLAAVQLFFAALIGVGNALVYGLSQKAVRDRDVKWCKEYCLCCGNDKVSVDFGMEPTHYEINLDDRI